MDPLTTDQSTAILSAAQSLQSSVMQLLAFAETLNPIIQANWNVTLPYSPNPLTLDAGKQSDATAAYQTMKAAILATVNTLP